MMKVNVEEAAFRMSCDEQFDLAKRLALNLGYQLEPEQHDPEAIPPRFVKEATTAWWVFVALCLSIFAAGFSLGVLAMNVARVM